MASNDQQDLPGTEHLDSSASPETQTTAIPATDAEAAPAPRKRAARQRVSRPAAAPAAAPQPDSGVEPPAATEPSVAPEASPTDDAEAAPAAAPKKKTPRERATRAKAAPAPSADDASAPQPAGDQVAAVPEATDEPATQDDFAVAVIGEDHVAALLAPSEAADDEDDTESAAEAPAAAAVPSFGVLFQAPEPAKVPRRATRAAAAPAESVDDEQNDADDSDDTPEPDDAPRARRGRGRGRGRGARADAETDRSSDEDVQASADDVDDSTDDPDTDSDDGQEAGGRRRRRRGGKGRRRGEPRADDGTDDGDSDDDTEGSDEASDDSTSAGDDNAPDAEESGGRKRTRRRRRSGSAGGEDDPPGTVTRVREPRKDRDEATGIKGSTRLEAKRQRRREGREAGRRRTIITEAEFLARRESVERTMVVRQQGERTQIGVLEDGVLVEHYISSPGSTSHTSGSSMAGNVYLGRVQNVLPSMEAAFVDIGKGRNAVLYAGEVNWDAAGLEQHKSRRIENALSSGQGVLVQVTKDPIGHKGARLTSQVSLPGRYLVYVPEGSMTGISRKLPDTERARLKKILKEIVPEDAGVIVRTAAEGASEKELTADVERLQKEWERITKKAKSGNAPVLLHGEPDLTVRVVRDVFNEDFASLVVSGDEAWDTVSDYVNSVAPDLADRVTKWTGEKDVFAAHRIDEQLAKAMDRKVWLPSGGSLVIDRTEAMTVVDVNTGKFTGAGGNLEETVTKNNLEAAEEIVRQLRLRDVGGIIVIDFIDMVLESNRDLVVRRLLECLGRDRTKHQVAEVTSLGLVQMTRKRVGAGLIEVFSEPCEHCSGRGLVVHAEPVDRAPSSVNDRGAGGSGEGRGRGRGRGRGKDSSGSETSSRSVSQPEPAPAGPTPAQIAAAAYAAAVQAGHGPDKDASDAEPLSPESAAQVTAAIEAGLAERSGAAADATGASSGRAGRGSRAAGRDTGSADDVREARADHASAAAPAADAPKVSGRVPRRASRRAGSDATSAGSTAEAAVTPSAAPTTQSEPAQAAVAPAAPAAPATRPRRAGRRAATSGPTAPTATAGTGVFTVSDAGGGNSEVQRALAATSAAGSSAETTAAPEGGVTTSVRRRRARVVAPAGAPGSGPSAESGETT